ncbi:hypothetical protein BMS3Bbin04_00466 [bacterium BMS3Bbin04]|nr:hypothetical protein BMS3Bbin04_00466 [bacterium BMS3Bbin04]
MTIFSTSCMYDKVGSDLRCTNPMRVAAEHCYTALWAALSFSDQNLPSGVTSKEWEEIFVGRSPLMPRGFTEWGYMAQYQDFTCVAPTTCAN